MTAQTRSVNKAKFENGDRPTGSDFADLIDSFLALTDTSAQTVASHVTFSSGATFGAPVTAPSVTTSAMTITGPVTADSATVSGAVTAGSIVVLGAGSFAGAVSANTVRVSGAATVGGLTTLGGFVQPVTALTVTGSTQSSAAPMIAGINAIATATNGTNDSCRLPVPVTGQSSVIVINAASTAIRVYPATGAAIGGAGVNNSISVTASTNAIFYATTGLQWYVIRGN